MPAKKLTDSARKFKGKLLGELNKVPQEFQGPAINQERAILISNLQKPEVKKSNGKK